MITLTLPVPPSTNALFRNRSAHERAIAAAQGRKLPGRARTEAYNSWRNAAGWQLKLQHPQKVPGAVEIEIVMRRMSKSADVDNRAKAVIDLLVEHRVIDDDCNVTAETTRWAAVDGCIVTVREAA
jgi:Holliday junction resolvase RusA-like endonuclease